MAKRIIELDKPLLGICAGFNNILRALGTDVIEDKKKVMIYMTMIIDIKYLLLKEQNYMT